MVAAIKVGEAGYAYIVDGKGRLIADRDPALASSQQDLSSLPQVQAALAAPPTERQREGNTFDTSPSGASVLSANAPVPVLGWQVFVERPVAEVFGPLWSAALRGIVLLVLGLAAVLLAGAAARRRVTSASTCANLRRGRSRAGRATGWEDRMHMRRRMLVALYGASLFGAALAQVMAKVYRIGWLVGSVPTPGVAYRKFVDRATQLGYVEGQTLLIDYRSFDTLDEGKVLAAELLRLKVDVIVAQAPPALLAARSATESVPIVTFFVGDPVRMGIVPSLGRPGGNVTGFTWDAGAEGVGKSLEITRELFPKARRIGLLWNQENDSGPFYAREYESHASSFGLAFVSVGVRTPEQFAPAFDRMAREKVSAVLVFTDPFTIRHRPALSAALGRYRLPALWGSVVWPLQGAVVSGGFNVEDQPRRAAEYMDRILKGAAPGELPFQQPTKFDLVIHAKTAREFGVPIPRSLLLRADRIEEQ